MTAVDALAGELLDALVRQLRARPAVAAELRAALGVAEGDAAHAATAAREETSSAEAAPELSREGAAAASGRRPKPTLPLPPDAVLAPNACAGALGEVTTVALAQQLGLSSARAARDWCKRHGVTYRRDGKLNWVRTDDVRRTLNALPTTRGPVTRQTAIEAAVARITGGAKR